MFGKRMNTIFWALIIPSIFFLFACTNFVNPIISKSSDGDYYNANLMEINKIAIGKGTYSSSLNWVILIILGCLFSLISILIFVKYILLSERFSNSKLRKFIPGIKKQIELGNYDYKLIDKENSQKERDSKIIFIFMNLMFASILISVLISIIVPFAMESQRVIAPANEIQAIGNNLTKVNELLAKYSNSGILWTNLIGVLLCGTITLALIITVIMREVQKTKQEKLALA